MTNLQAPVDRVLHALASPARRTIVERLGLGPASVSDLAELLDVALPTVLQHLTVLAEGGVVRTEKIGRVRTCRLETEALSAIELWIVRQRAEWESRLDRLDAYLADLQHRGEKP